MIAEIVVEMKLSGNLTSLIHNKLISMTIPVLTSWESAMLFPQMEMYLLQELYKLIMELWLAKKTRPLRAGQQKEILGLVNL